MSDESTKLAKLGVVIVTFNSADVIEKCLESLAASQGVELRIVVVDNASSDETRARIGEWIGAHDARRDYELVEEPVNGGYAHGVNAGLRHLIEDPQIDLFWVLNPDCRVMPDTASHYCEAARRGPFSLLGGRTVFDAQPDLVQTDGGRISRLTGRCSSINRSLPRARAPYPDEAMLDFITGASCVASRAFIERAGLMREDYFLYYEEVDWAFRRGDLPLRFVPQAEVRHIGGTAIGSATLGRRASAFSHYFNFRGRAIFMRRFMPLRYLFTLAHGVAKAAHLALGGHRREGLAIVSGVLGLTPPREVRDRLGPESLALLTPKPGRTSS